MFRYSPKIITAHLIVAKLHSLRAVEMISPEPRIQLCIHCHGIIITEGGTEGQSAGPGAYTRPTKNNPIYISFSRSPLSASRDIKFFVKA